jgi:hypothetical protein
MLVMSVVGMVGVVGVVGMVKVMGVVGVVLMCCMRVSSIRGQQTEQNGGSPGRGTGENNAKTSDEYATRGSGTMLVLLAKGVA